MSFKRLLYLISVITDFSAFIVVFAVSRSLAERGAEPWYLGTVGAGLSFSIGVGSLLGGWLAQRFDPRGVFISGASFLCISALVCGVGDITSLWFLFGYWLLGFGLGCLYPPLIGWLNEGTDPIGNRRGVSRTLILFCVSWNVGMMCGQLTAGSLFLWGTSWAYAAALTLALFNLILTTLAVSRIRPRVRELGPEQEVDQQAAERAVIFKRLSWIANLGGMFGGSMVIHLLPDLVVTIGISADLHGSLLACWRAAIIATYLLMHAVSFWQYRFSTSAASQVLAAAGLLLIASAETARTLLVGLVLLGQLVGYNYFSGLVYSTAGSSRQRRTFAAGIHEATLAAGMAFGTIVGGVFGSLVSQRLPYLLASGMLVILVAIQFFAKRRWTLGRRRLSKANRSLTGEHPDRREAEVLLASGD